MAKFRYVTLAEKVLDPGPIPYARIDLYGDVVWGLAWPVRGAVTGCGLETPQRSVILPAHPSEH